MFPNKILFKLNESIQNTFDHMLSKLLSSVLDKYIVIDAAVVIQDGADAIKDGVVVFQDGAVVIQDGAVVIQDGDVVIQDGDVVIQDGAVVIQDAAVVIQDAAVDVFIYVHGLEGLVDFVIVLILLTIKLSPFPLYICCS